MGCFFLVYACVLSAQPKNNNMVSQSKPRIHATYTVVDYAPLRVSYALNADDVEDIGTYVDLQRLEIGNRISKYYSELLFHSDSLCAIWAKQHPQAGSFPYWKGETGKSDSWSEYQSTEIFRSGGKQTLYCRMPFNLEKHNCQYTESYPQQAWTLCGDTLTICGYLCQKAVCSYRGRDFEAWFAPDIPVKEGPWTFGGLPGLILKVQDTKRLYVFECVRIEPGNFPVKTVDYSNYKSVDRKKLLKLQRKINEDYFSLMGFRDESGKPRSFYKPYEPLELE